MTALLKTTEDRWRKKKRNIYISVRILLRRCVRVHLGGRRSGTRETRNGVLNDASDEQIIFVKSKYFFYEMFLFFIFFFLIVEW